MEERVIIQVVGQVMVYDGSAKQWHPAGTSSGKSSVRLIQCLPSNTFRIHAQKINELKEVVLDSQITREVKYNLANEVFIQWHDSQAFWGLNFRKGSPDAESFFAAVVQVLKILNQNANPTIQQQALPNMQQDMMNNVRQQLVVQQQQQQQNSAQIAHITMQQQQQQQQQQGLLQQQQQQLLRQQQLSQSMGPPQAQQLLQQGAPAQLLQQQVQPNQQQQQLLQQQQIHQQYVQSQQHQQQPQVAQSHQQSTQQAQQINYYNQQQQPPPQPMQPPPQQPLQQQQPPQQPQQQQVAPAASIAPAAPIPPPPPPPPAPPALLNNRLVMGNGPTNIAANTNNGAQPNSNSLQHSPVTTSISNGGGSLVGDIRNSGSPNQATVNSSLANELAKCQLRKVNLSRSDSEKESECNNNVIPNAKTTRAASLACRPDGLMSDLTKKLALRNKQQSGDNASSSSGNSNGNGNGVSNKNCINGGTNLDKGQESWLADLIRKEISKEITKMKAEIIDVIKAELRQR